MRILMVSEDVPEAAMGGLARHAVTLAVALAQVGHEVDFLGRAVADPDAQARLLGLPGRLFTELPNLQGGWKERATGMFNPIKREILAWRLARAILARASAYDVVHYHGHFPNVAAYLPSGINFIQTRHDQGSDCLAHTRFRKGEVCVATDPTECAGCVAVSPNAFQRAMSAWAVRLYRRQVRKGFARHKTVFVSDMLRRNFARTAGSGEWGVVIHNFLDAAALEEALQTFTPEASREDRKVEVVIAGKLYPPKGIGRFLEVAKGRLPAHLHISVLGSGPEEAELRVRFEGPQISFLGWQDYPSVIRYTAQADAVVVPSVCEESCATTVLEALALGRHVYALERGGTPELAVYADQHLLRLYPDMESLVEGLAGIGPGRGWPSSVHLSGCTARDRIPELLKLYVARQEQSCEQSGRTSPI